MCEKIKKTIEKCAKDLEKLALNVHANPELGLHEHKACAWQVKLLKKWGFSVKTPFGGLNTAYKAVYGKGKPVFCFISEYDALPDLGHGCGHNLICAASLGAGYALAQAMKAEKIKGSVVVMGTPAEESIGGKITMLKNKAFDGLDAVIMAHPLSKTLPDKGSSAVSRFEVVFRGKAAHAAAEPQKGKNALDAVMLLFHGVSVWRQQLDECSRIHGVVDHGGEVPNIIPDYASCVFFLRSPCNKRLEELTKRFKNIAKGAALMTETAVEIESLYETYKSCQPNDVLNNLYMEEAEKAGLTLGESDTPTRASTDFGNVSCVVPGSHVYFSISKKDIPCHSIEFREAAAGKYGIGQMLKTAEALAKVGYRWVTC